MIVSGGVNIAVFGIPDAEMGEQVKAVVQPAAGVGGGEELEAELLTWCRSHLAAYKCPKSVDFEAQLPRLDTGKLYKRLLRDRYWGDSESRIV
jgi:fatty-acyl-CoA synthase